MVYLIGLNGTKKESVKLKKNLLFWKKKDTNELSRSKISTTFHVPSPPLLLLESVVVDGLRVVGCSFCVVVVIDWVVVVTDCVVVVGEGASVGLVSAVSKKALIQF